MTNRIGAPTIPEPKGWGTFDVEPFEQYYRRWPAEYAHVPTPVVETWVYRHWREFQLWLPLQPFDWSYEVTRMRSDEILTVGHVRRWPEILRFWGDDLFDQPHRRTTWLGRTMLELGTTPAPIIIARAAGQHGHPREGKANFREPYQLIEGHMRIAYLHAMIRRKHSPLLADHEVIIATLPIDLDE